VTGWSKQASKAVPPPALHGLAQRGDLRSFPAHDCALVSADGGPPSHAASGRRRGSPGPPALFDWAGDDPSALRPQGLNGPVFAAGSAISTKPANRALAAGFPALQGRLQLAMAPKGANSSAYITLLCWKGKITLRKYSRTGRD